MDEHTANAFLASFREDAYDLRENQERRMHNRIKNIQAGCPRPVVRIADEQDYMQFCLDGPRYTPPSVQAPVTTSLAKTVKWLGRVVLAALVGGIAGAAFVGMQ